MTQQKAASLTSSLFARKGKASPASLLISEMDSAGPRSAAPVVAKSATNGSARRKPKATAELPLLAFVEAQVGAEDGTTEPAPAASLLERGARSLRRVDERHLAPEQQAVGIEVPEAAVPEVEMVEVETAEIETVSGDANVAAIEDAPPEETTDDDAAVDMAVVIAAPDPVAEDSVIVDTAAASEAADPPEADTPEADTTVVIAPQDAATGAGAESAAVAGEETKAGAGDAPPSVGTGPVPAPAAPAPTAPITTTVALRRAAAQPRGPVTHSPVTHSPVTHSPLTQGLWWRGAAMVALGVALGFGAYLAFSGTPGQPPAVQPVQKAAPPPADSGEALPAVAAAPAADEAATAATPVAEVEAPDPSFDIIRIEPDGHSIIAGRAQPFSEWILLNNGSPIATVVADANGEWVVLPDASLVPGANDFSLVPKTERGRVAIPAPLAEPDGGDGSSVAPRSELKRIEGEIQGSVEPLPGDVPVEAPAAAVALPKPKPAGAATAMQATMTEAFRVSQDGGYEVQVASVRQNNDAQRERDRLEGAFPELLARLDLRVQEASVEGAGTFYRVRSGAIGDLGVARELCRRLEARGQGCLVVRRDVEAPAPEPVTELVEDVPAEPAVSAVGQQAERPQ